MSDHTYDVYLEREGRFWLVRVPETDSLTQARNLGEAEQMAREIIASDLDLPSVDDVKVTIRGHIIAGVTDIPNRIESITANRARAQESETAAAVDTRKLAGELVAAGITVRDIGQILGVSYQRAHQLVQDAGNHRAA